MRQRRKFHHHAKSSVPDYSLRQRRPGRRGDPVENRWLSGTPSLAESSYLMREDGALCPKRCRDAVLARTEKSIPAPFISLPTTVEH